ncbi:HpcH/HpaI aldolase/citrate lyase family protein [Clostridium sp. MSJ-8]|uniref:HpcH/HpaI aldolase/citrate lyase family protein n=1 Tax=Clostridium sp. MSJ-8 TaxID=2841510 RepID=UPI001C0EE5E7|nr:HpcH/HpaI aldolase/citrate lyase family protein [Clostridium sp. MSJ-8]MBU5488299.1 HpcH/HpaI aldolase/citrate lyase family protein [Clostridium sp. MSJ-8]
MKNSLIYYSVGALLYCPANNKSISNSIISEKFGKKYSLALCLEDTIHDNHVLEAEAIMINSLKEIYTATKEKLFYIPKIFIRVRNSDQMQRIFYSLGEVSNILCGFILPKFSLDNADNYIDTLIKINKESSTPIYAMPIYENSSIIDLRHRYNILYALKDKLAAVEKLILNIRVGGNDLCHVFGFRRQDNESIHQIKPIANIFADIITVYGSDYVISGPVWEYYNSSNWKNGLISEIKDDKICGFIGKTVIHPKQISVVNDSYKVCSKDLEDAKSILNWDDSLHSLVSGNIVEERMNEYKTHYNWALQTVLMAESFGIK